jgi:hypothetical protein
MNLAPMPRDHLAAAAARVERTTLALEEARKNARRIGERIDWLADRPDLARLQCLAKDQPHLQSQLARERAEYQQAFDYRLNELTKSCPFTAPPELSTSKPIETPRNTVAAPLWSGGSSNCSALEIGVVSPGLESSCPPPGPIPQRGVV